MSLLIKTLEIPQGIKQCTEQLNPFLKSIDSAMFRLTKQMEPVDKRLKQLNNDVFQKIDFKKLNSNLEPLFKQTKPLIGGLKQVSKFLETTDFEELRFNMHRLQKCSPYMDNLKDKTTLQDILIAIEGVPESEYEKVLIQKLGKRSVRKRLNKRAAKKAKQKLIYAWTILSTIFTIISVFDLPLPKNISEALQVLFRYPKQTVQYAHKNTTVPQSIYQNVTIVRTRKRKNRRHKRR